MRRDEGPLRLHLEGNDFGSGAFALALASKAGQVGRCTCHDITISVKFVKSQDLRQVTLVHPWIDLLAKRMEAGHVW